MQAPPALALEIHLSQALSAELEAILTERLTATAEPNLEILRATHTYISHHYEPTYNRLQQFLQYHKLAAEMALRLAAATEGSNIDVCREVLVWYWSSMMCAFLILFYILGPRRSR